MKPLVNMRAALEDRDLFGTILTGESWAAWRVLLIAMMGEALNREERRIFHSLTKRVSEPMEAVEIFVGIVGRRGGKSRAAAVLAAFIAALCDHAGKIVPGERPLVLCLAQNTRQASITFGYIVALFETIQALAGMVTNRTADSLTLSNGVVIEVRPASFRGLRGITALAVLADETCFWRTDETSRNADSEIITAILPSLATTGGPLIMISSPYSKSGATWNFYEKHFGADGDPLILVAQGASKDFNPSLPQRVVDRAMEADPESASAEYMGLWRTDLAAFVDRSLVESAVDYGVFARPPVQGKGYAYRAGCDPSGGARDSFTMAVAHDEGGVSVLDCLVEVRAPFNPSEATASIAATIKSYGLQDCVGDKYAAAWVVEAFGKHGVKYRHSERDRSAIYMDALPLFSSGRVRLIENARLVNQFASLERRTSAIGRDRVDHGPSGADDCSNSAALALVLAATPVVKPPALASIPFQWR